MAEIPDIVPTVDIKLEPNTPFSYVGWGIRYKLSPGGEYRVSAMIFNNKSNAEDWAKERFVRYEEITAEAVPVRRTLLMDDDGYIERWTFEYTG